jgi:hypothetical protein
MHFTARIVLFGGTNLEEETYSSSTLQQHHQQQSPAFRSRPPPFPSPSRPRPRSVAPEFHRRSTNIDYSEDKAMTLSRSNLDRGPTQERCNYFDFRPSTSLDYVPTYQRSNFDYAPTYQRSNFDQSLEISSKWRLISSLCLRFLSNVFVLQTISVWFWNKDESWYCNLF